MAPERNSKPESFKLTKELDLRDYPELDPKCPFCPGSEEWAGIDPIKEFSNADGEWNTRLIENKYKIFDNYSSCPIEPEPFDSDGIYTKYQGCGNHLLVLESRLHNQVAGNMTTEEIENILKCYSAAFDVMKKNGNNLITIFFKNQGSLAGGSQPHAHSQIVGSRIVPAWIRNALHVQEKHFDGRGCCAMCTIIKHERKEETRVAMETEHTMVLSPYAAGSPYELWVVPKRHFACYGNILEEERADLADCLRKALNTYVTKLDNPDFNYFIHSSPTPMAAVPFYHSYIQIVPRLWNEGGFEVGTKIPVNGTLPEEALKTLF